MTEPFVGEIRMFGFNYAPEGGWLPCNGDTVPVRSYQALFAVIGTLYGGDGVNNFKLPNLCGRVPLSFGQAATGTMYPIGQTAGKEVVNLVADNLPPHTHALMATTTEADTDLPTGAAIANARSNTYVKPDSKPTLNTNFMAGSVGPTGKSVSVENRQPYLVLNFCIASEGVFPPRP